GLHWVDPHNKEYWDYIVDIAKEAVRLGFQEIQFDYVRFTSDGNTKRCVYPFGNGLPAEDVIQEFLKYTRAKLAQYDIPVSADIFGLTTSANADLGIGQRFEKIAEHVDIVCPMVYPSHYIPGNFGLKNPNAQPYKTVFSSVRDAKLKLETAQNTTTQIRPWLQDFSLGVRYGRDEIQAQIKAVEDAGIKEWIFWNPSCRYDVTKYNK
ncbi:MAG TPA: putative glycoside hydrolase, partial [Bacillota bacterium]|nr:putative glycoside hydrolase [Bacillota bacterium]